MNLLLDTHIALWALSDDPRLSETARRLIVDPANSVTVSVVSLWEISIKHALRPSGPSGLAISGGEALQLCEAAGYQILPIGAAHAVALDDLERLHGDPFDRLLVAQALTEPMRLLTHDDLLARYSDTVIVV